MDLPEPFVVLDTETTGLGSDAEIVQITVLSSEGETLFHSLLRPKHRISVEASAVHGILDMHLTQSPSFPTVWPEVEELLKGHTIVAYNAAFDRRMIEQECARYLLDPPDCEWRCAMNAYTSRNGRRTSLTKACGQEGIPVKDAHDSLADCRMTLELVRRLAPNLLAV